MRNSSIHLTAKRAARPELHCSDYSFCDSDAMQTLNIISIFEIEEAEPSLFFKACRVGDIIKPLLTHKTEIIRTLTDRETFEVACQ